jgi:L-asparaginase
VAVLGQQRVTVALVGTGGTITAWSPDPLDLTGYTEAESERLSLAELVAAVPQVADVAEVRQVPVPAGPSHALGLPELLGIADRVRTALADGDVHGAVVTHGTNTLEELAFLLSLVLEPAKPTVVTGAMRPLSGLSGDGPLNLVDAVRVASCPRAAGRGVLVAMGGSIWSARQVTKARTAGTDAFGGGDLGPLGFVDPDGSVVFHHGEERRPLRLDVTAGDRIPRVDLVSSYPGADGVLIDAAVAAGAAGLVSAGTGAGFPTPAEHAALLRAADAGVVVCQSYRGSAGRVHPRPGLRRAGLVAGQDLSPFKCRILLALALVRDADAGRIQGLFDSVGGS